MTDRSNPLLDTIECVSDDAVGDTVKLGTMLDDVAERGYGPLVMFLSAFVILPTGMIPGVPAIIGLALLYVAGPMVLGRTSPVFPKRLRSFEVETRKVQKSVEKARPWARRINYVLKPRMTGLTTGRVATRITGLAVVLSGVIMIPLGFIPMLPFILGLTTLVLGLGLTARDGVLILIGYALFAVGLYFAMPGLGGF